MSQDQLNEYELRITADAVRASGGDFDIDNMSPGDKYKFLDTYCIDAAGKVIRREREKNEAVRSNRVMPRLAFQIFEPQISALPLEERESFPICRYGKNIQRGIFRSVEEFKHYKNTAENVKYYRKMVGADSPLFVTYCWNVFSTVLFVQECLKRWGNIGDTFVLKYREKGESEQTNIAEKSVGDGVSDSDSKGQDHVNRDPAQGEQPAFGAGPRNPYSQRLLESKNIIFRGAPGTGKSYLAKEVAADIISNGACDRYESLTDEQQRQVAFVQFHPSYDYSDFVEGLRPKINADGSMGFELRDGIFTRFVERAQKNADDSRKSKETIEKETSVRQQMNDFFAGIELGIDEMHIAHGTRFVITSIDDKHISISIPDNAVANTLRLDRGDIQAMLESERSFHQVKDLTDFFGKLNATQGYSYDLAIYEAIRTSSRRKSTMATDLQQKKPFVFIIDEINRGEISKILGELFFAIDPGYRGESGGVSTQYANLHEDPDRKFSIPDNVYIIGTMNDIDRSVDTFDFAMRRRFRFIEIKAEDRVGMLDELGHVMRDEAIGRMTALNAAISQVDELNENYHIGAAYFLKLKELDGDFGKLWDDYLQPLLQDYVRGMVGEDRILGDFKQAYDIGRTPMDTIDGDLTEAGIAVAN